MVQFKRGSGVLLHPSALPGSQGIGCLGAQALAFLRWLNESGQTYWQICPLVPTGFGDSPYQGLSAFAGNPNLIDLEELVDLGLLIPADLDSLKNLPSGRVDFRRLVPEKTAKLRKAWRSFSESSVTHPLRDNFKQYQADNHEWLADFSLFMVLKEHNNGRSWAEWDNSLRFRNAAAIESARNTFSAEISYHEFVQFIFDTQWKRIHREAGRLGIQIIGDLPIFVSYDSSDCWSRPDLFLLDSRRMPTHVAGVPPDYFSSTGQLWGNPLYNWKVMKKNGYAWWIRVLKTKLKQYDILRIDHFRGFSAYWSVPFGEETAVNGKWVPAPGKDLFRKVKLVLGDPPVIAEDLGVITEDVVELIEYCGFPRMKVLQFAFDSAEQNDYLPHTFDRNCLVYTGTHDNDTVAGWYGSAPEDDKKAAREYLGLPETVGRKKIAQAMLRTALASVADLAITPLQDILGLGSNARFNLPGTLGTENWSWRVDKSVFTSDLAEYLKKLTEIYGRMLKDEN